MKWKKLMRIADGVDALQHSALPVFHGHRIAVGDALPPGYRSDIYLVKRQRILAERLETRRDGNQLVYLFIFTAEYRGGKTKTYDAYVIVDDSDPYWRIHRLF